MADDMIQKALYQQMRLTILLTAKDGIEQSPFDGAYLYAWDNGVYPIKHGFPEWHEPHEQSFRVREDEIRSLLRFLDDRWMAKEPITFYELEDHYEVALGRGPWDRGSLICACRYLLLDGCFDQEFWSVLCRNGDCPSEALHINDPEYDRVSFR